VLTVGCQEIQYRAIALYVSLMLHDSPGSDVAGSAPGRCFVNALSGASLCIQGESKRADSAMKPRCEQTTGFFQPVPLRVQRREAANGSHGVSSIGLMATGLSSGH
jgi:hypothetical protein